MKHATLCLPITDTHVLLGRKKLRWGAGKWNGFGGKLKNGETPEAAALRELQEESGLVASSEDIQKVAVLAFHFNEDTPVFLMHTYLTRLWSGEAKETDEMLPQWHALNAVPYDEMWDADRVWMKEILEGKKLAARVFFTIDGTPGEDKEVFNRIEYDDSLWSL